MAQRVIKLGPLPVTIKPASRAKEVPVTRHKANDALSTPIPHCLVSMCLALRQSQAEKLPEFLPHYHEGRDMWRWVFQWAHRIRCVRALIIYMDTCCQPELRFCEHVLELTLSRAHRHM